MLYQTNVVLLTWWKLVICLYILPTLGLHKSKLTTLGNTTHSMLYVKDNKDLNPYNVCTSTKKLLPIMIYVSQGTSKSLHPPLSIHDVLRLWYSKIKKSLVTYPDDYYY